MTASAVPAGPARPHGAGIGAGWRRWRAPAATVAIILLGGLVIAMLTAGPAATGQLDPRDAGPAGAHALVALLTGQGKHVSRVDTVAVALTQSRAPGTAVVIADPGQLAPSSLPKLAAAPADLLIIAPTRDALAALVPRRHAGGRGGGGELPAAMLLAGCPAGRPRRHGRSAPPLAGTGRLALLPGGPRGGDPPRGREARPGRTAA